MQPFLIIPNPQYKILMDSAVTSTYFHLFYPMIKHFYPDEPQSIQKKGVSELFQENENDVNLTLWLLKWQNIN